jgi:hypothetical protein
MPFLKPKKVPKENRRLSQLRLNATLVDQPNTKMSEKKEGGFIHHSILEGVKT